MSLDRHPKPPRRLGRPRGSAVIPGGVNSGQRRVPGLEDLVITATSGSTFTDGDGRVYTDYHAAFGPPLLGHNDPDVDAAAAAAGRSVDLMGIGVTPGRDRARRAARRRRAVAREGAAHLRPGSEATFHALRRRAHGHRPAPRDQVPGLLPRLARLGGDERDLARRARRRQGPALAAGSSPRSSTATIVCPFNDADEVERALDEHDVAAIILEPIPHNIGAVLPQPGLPRAAARARDEARHRARLRRGDHRLPPRARRLPGDRRRHARPDDARQGDGERLARLGARRQGRADGPLLDHPGPARLLRRHVQRPPRDDRRRARDDREARARAGARARLPARRARPRRACTALYDAARRAGRRRRASARSSSPTSSKARS